MRINNILIKPVVTEKAIDLHNREGKYTFEVSLYSTQREIKSALKDVYDIEVTALRSNVLPGKRRRIPKTPRFRTTEMTKKVIFKVKKGKLDIYQGE
jgi:large subunit ribosomal protein L23